jgi:hypothetical protein
MISLQIAFVREDNAESDFRPLDLEIRLSLDRVLSIDKVLVFPNYLKQEERVEQRVLLYHFEHFVLPPKHECPNCPQRLLKAID